MSLYQNYLVELELLTHPDDKYSNSAENMKAVSTCTRVIPQKETQPTNKKHHHEKCMARALPTSFFNMFHITQEPLGTIYQLVVSTWLKNTSQNGNLPQIE